MQTGPFPSDVCRPRISIVFAPDKSIDAGLDMAMADDDADGGVDDSDAGDMMLGDAGGPDMAPDMARPPVVHQFRAAGKRGGLDHRHTQLRIRPTRQRDSAFPSARFESDRRKHGCALRDLPVTFSLPTIRHRCGH